MARTVGAGSGGLASVSNWGDEPKDWTDLFAPAYSFSLQTYWGSMRTHPMTSQQFEGEGTEMVK